MVGVGLGIGVSPSMYGSSIASSVNPVFNGVISAYNADGDANDYTTYANGTLTNGATAVGTAKVGTNSFSLDGVNDYVDLGTNKFNYTTDFSVSAWFYSPDVTATKALIGNSSYVATNRGWLLFHTGSRVYCSFYNEGILDQVATTAILTNNTWTHVVFTYSTTNGKKIYLDGVSRGTNASTSAPNYNTAKAYIGAFQSDAIYYYFNGNLDAVQVWDSELTAANATTLYNSGNGLQP